MSIKQNAAKIVLLGFLGTSLGVAGMFAYDRFHSMHRGIASAKIDSSKWSRLPLGKHLSTLNTEIEKLEAIPDTSEQEVTLTGYIHIRQRVIGDIEYNWIVPPEVKIVSGHQSDGIAEVKVGDVIKVQISVTGFSKEMQSTITFSATAHEDGLPVGSSAIIVSKPEETWEGVAQDMKKSAEEQLQENAVKVTK